MPVTRAEIDAICGPLPGATLAEPPELLSWKVGGKMFACIGAQDGREGVSVKCADGETAAMLIETGAADRVKYFHRSWVRLHADATDVETARHRIHVSYDIVRASLKRGERAALPPREGA